MTTAARIFGHLQGIVRIPHAHVKRDPPLVGTARVPLHAPVAFHCIFILGFDSTDSARSRTRSLGSFVYGVFAVKLFFVHDHDHPRWTLPLVGGTLFAVIVTLWATSAYWYFTEVRFGF